MCLEVKPAQDNTQIHMYYIHISIEKLGLFNSMYPLHYQVLFFHLAGIELENELYMCNICVYNVCWPVQFLFLIYLFIKPTCICVYISVGFLYSFLYGIFLRKTSATYTKVHSTLFSYIAHLFINIKTQWTMIMPMTSCAPAPCPLPLSVLKFPISKCLMMFHIPQHKISLRFGLFCIRKFCHEISFVISISILFFFFHFQFEAQLIKCMCIERFLHMSVCVCPISRCLIT